jgi:Zn-dependent protease with chaperone function
MWSSRAGIAVVASAVMVVLSFVYNEYVAAGVFLVFFLIGLLTLLVSHYSRKLH